MCSAADWQKQAGDDLLCSSSWGRSFLSSSTPWRPALLRFTQICITAAGLQRQCLTTAKLRDKNRYISDTSSQDVDLRAGERKPAHAYSQERAGDAAKPHPNFPRHWAADNRAQRQCTLPAGLQFKNTKSGCPTGVGRVSFSSTQSNSWLGRRATKPQLQRGKGELKEARHIRGRKRGSFDERNNNKLGCITLLRLLHIFQWWRDLYREAKR